MQVKLGLQNLRFAAGTKTPYLENVAYTWLLYITRIAMTFVVRAIGRLKQKKK